MTPTSISPSAESFSAGAPATVGVLLCHGFTGSPASLRPLANHLAQSGLRVELPRLPGHGTHWRELQLTQWQDWYAAVEARLLQLNQECSRVFVVGLSMGGALALRLAQEQDVAGLVLVNPAIASHDWRMRLLPVLKHLVPTTSALGDDIARPDVTEHGYPRTPLRAAHSMMQLWQTVRAELAHVECDVLLLTSRVDHVVDRASGTMLMEQLPHVERVWLDKSHHVATLDHDAELVQQLTLDFIEARR